MIDLRDAIRVIEDHIAEGSARSLTYAALECRLAIERICYDRLAKAHDYISSAEIRRWQPHHVIRILEEDVDPHVASTFTFSISDRPVVPGENIQAMNYVPVGTQQGFDGSLLAKLWNALSNTALHVSLPKSKADEVPVIGNVEKIKPKVEAALREIRRIASGTLTSTGMGTEITFTCPCGLTVKRRASGLPAGKIIHCINPECTETFEVEHEGEDINFVVRAIRVECECGEQVRVAMSPLEKLGPSESATAVCICGAEHLFHWKLFHGVKR